MTYSRFFLLGLLLWIFLAALRVIVFKYFDVSSFIVELLLGLFTVVFAVALARRLGVINYLEAALVAMVWFILVLLLDFYITQHIVGARFFTTWQTWACYGVFMAAVFFFHKKRHIMIRHQQQERHH